MRISELVQEGGGTRANPTISTIFGVPRLRLLEEDPPVNEPLVVYCATSWPLQIETACSRFLSLPQGCPIGSTVCVGPTEIQCLGGGWPLLSRYISESDTPDLPLPFPDLFEAAYQPSGILWGEHTILSFHQFLVVLTLAYARALNHLKFTMEDSTLEICEKKRCISMVLNFGRLLSAVVYSYAFKFHLELLGAANLLRVPPQLYLLDLLTFAK